jgi:hypothetical protein
MKLGIIRSPYPYDAAAHRALQSASLRRTAILHYASRAAVSDFAGWSGYPRSIAAMPSASWDRRGSTRWATCGLTHRSKLDG